MEAAALVYMFMVFLSFCRRILEMYHAVGTITSQMLSSVHNRPFLSSYTLFSIDDKPLGFFKGGELLDRLSDYQLLKKCWLILMGQKFAVSGETQACVTWLICRVCALMCLSKCAYRLLMWLLHLHEQSLSLQCLIYIFSRVII